MPKIGGAAVAGMRSPRGTRSPAWRALNSSSSAWSANSGGRRTTSLPWMSPRFFRRSSTSARSSAFTVSLAAPAMAQPPATNRWALCGNDAMLLVQVQRLVEAFAQLGQVLQRTAQKGDVAADGTAARQAGDGLRHHGLEDGRGDVLAARAFVKKRLHVGFREHAAAAGDGIDGGGMLRQLVQAAGVGVQERRHLVDERAGAAGARAVHALLDAVVEVDDLRVLAAELDGHVGFRDEGFDGGLAGDDLLHELDAEPLGQKQAARSGDGDGHASCRRNRARPRTAPRRWWRARPRGDGGTPRSGSAFASSKMASLTVVDPTSMPICRFSFWLFSARCSALFLTVEWGRRV